ncbi:hypothetical protein O9G_000784 [Rozella allomycis CSF55]|uniref:Uncharacterized protein n=1 Tax=Rozella allomycis (strain CSF55) TaxID=988480 RepID=A0A075AW11_ROZAC|nr:hypothetical protein O9G_000784 [Rozella allomycis CSF55]|eukprot:EPZ32709.1 hypothetical protein O9G_000784 [Rozella allomycis CSF55]
MNFNEVLDRPISKPADTEHGIIADKMNQQDINVTSLTTFLVRHEPLYEASAKGDNDTGLYLEFSMSLIECLGKTLRRWEYILNLGVFLSEDIKIQE